MTSREPLPGQVAGAARLSSRQTSFNDPSREAEKEVQAAVSPAQEASPSSAQPPTSSTSPGAERTVLDASDISRALTRISHEILERNKGADDLLLLGIPTRGVALAQRIGARLNSAEGVQVPVGSLDATMYRDDLRLRPARALAHTEIPEPGVDGKTVVLVDDVLFSGRTIRAALDALNDVGRPHAVRLATLVDRGHRELPIRADFVGKNLPTSMTEKVRVLLEEYDGRDCVVIAEIGQSTTGQSASGAAR
jgi:pyrimidine operon attenuation protein / uracil phosphoribosyltransferase